MSDSVSALTPPDLPVAPRRDPADAGAPEAREVRFRELWADKENGLGFADLLDIVNPLQHLPVVGTLYRALTGDQISLGARLAGGALFGGPLGVLGAAALAASEEATGGEPGQHIVAALQDMFGGESEAATGRLAGNGDPAALGDIAPAAGAPDDDAAATRDGGWSAVVGPDSEPAPAAETAPPAPAATAAPLLSPATLVPRGPAAVPAPAAGAARPAHPAALREFPAFPATRTPATRGVPPTLRPGLSPSNAAPAAPAGAPRADAPVQDSESRRILAAVEEARRAQAALLLANINAAPAPVRADGEGDDATRQGAGRASADPFRSHPLIPPQGASPAWIGRAMERALDKYQQSQRLPRGAGAAVPEPVQ